MKSTCIKNIIILLLFLSVWPIQSFSQSKPVCYHCNQPITGNYIKAEGKTFHPDHFMCDRCGKVIRGDYKTKDGKFYHPDCYALAEGKICAYCNKPLEREYVVFENKKYHRECLREHVLQKCPICSEPIEGRFIVDGYKNKFHAYHKNEYPECDCCGRLVCAAITGGGVKYSDGRNICSICYKSAVSDQNRIRSLLNKVKSKLMSFGLNFGSNTISIRGVDKNELRRNASRFDNETRGYCNSRITTETMNGRVVRKITTHEILVLNGIPAVMMESIIAHELMHAWMNDNASDNQPDNIKEGSCNYISYLYLNTLPESQSADDLRRLEENPDPVYGGGFRTIKNRFNGKKLEELLSYLKKG